MNPLGLFTRHVRVTRTGESPTGESVALNVSTPPWVPGFGPPKPSKLVNALAAHVPLVTTVPPAVVSVNEPLATIVLAATSKLPDPGVRMMSVVEGPRAVLGLRTLQP